ncbi:hypothetical protein GGI12_004058 [Dipsacomyces acuminosporus]|nr:hypothetical protein GGI12_004058 [Dipsacomyces acuminosporus]
MHESLGPEWLPGGQAYRIRAISMFCVYGVYTVFVFTTLAMFLVQSRNMHSELSKRSVTLVALQTTGAFVAGTAGLISSAVIDWSCFFKLWLLTIGMVLLMTTLSARAVQLIVVSKTHSLNSQLARNGPQFMQSIKGKLLRKFSVSKKSQKSTIQAAGSEFIDKQILDDAIKGSRSFMDANKRDAVLKKLARYIRLQPYVTDRMLAIYISCAMALAVVITIVISAVNKGFSLKPMNTVCTFYWGFIPLYAIGTLFLVIVCPALLLMTWGLKDAYGIRTELAICVTVGLVGHIAMIVWETKLGRFNSKWSGLFFLWFSVFLIHVFSAVVPLWRSTRHVRKLDVHLRSESPTSTSTVALMKDAQLVHNHASAHVDEEKRIRRNQYGKFRQAFVHVLEDPELYDRFSDFASSCFCSELISFIDEYQMLKVLTLIALGQRAYSAVPAQGSDSSPLMQNAIPATPNVSNNSSSHSQDPHTALPLNVDLANLQSNATIDILETAKEVYPGRGFSHTTVFPPALVDTLVTICSSYINAASPTAVNVPQVLTKRIQEKLDRNQLYLTIFDEVKDEVLYMLYLNVFIRFSP